LINIAVIGAGPKAAAIAAKAEVLNRIANIGFNITIFEKGRIGNNWTGPSAYTDGEQLLCTPAERDVGFPYDTSIHSEVPHYMQADYSWMAYSVQKGDQSYSDWVNRGTLRPTHNDFSEYVRFVIERSDAKCEELTEVVSLRAKRRKWIVTVRTSPLSSPCDFDTEFDGVVVTGPGPAKGVVSGTKNFPGLFDCENVWNNLSDVKQRLRKYPEDLVIVGGGGAAAAIASWLIESGFQDHAIRFIAPQATFYMRSGGFFENRVFDDEQLWALLSQKEQSEFIDRITRGVVWQSVSDRLVAAKQLSITPGRATSIAQSPEQPELLLVDFAPAAGGQSRQIEASVVIDASGFDTWWFRNLLPKPYNDARKLQKAANHMKRNLQLPLGSLPPIHVPNVASRIGPGYSSLMVLGRMSDRILIDYVDFT
jgi:mycobactin lysine-N-oxygenase